MNLEQIATINKFITRGKLQLVRKNDVFLIIRLDENGRAGAIKNPIFERSGGVHIMLTEKEIASLASLCLPAKENQ